MSGTGNAPTTGHYLWWVKLMFEVLKGPNSMATDEFAYRIYDLMGLCPFHCLPTTQSGH